MIRIRTLCLIGFYLLLFIQTKENFYLVGFIGIWYLMVNLTRTDVLRVALIGMLAAN